MDEAETVREWSLGFQRAELRRHVEWLERRMQQDPDEPRWRLGRNHAFEWLALLDGPDPSLKSSESMARLESLTAGLVRLMDDWNEAHGWLAWSSLYFAACSWQDRRPLWRLRAEHSYRYFETFARSQGGDYWRSGQELAAEWLMLIERGADVRDVGPSLAAQARALYARDSGTGLYGLLWAIHQWAGLDPRREADSEGDVGVPPA